ncbi:coiled-coil domain-containing protein [Rhodoferax sp.]|uniref:coiled-coil domain-containing protein n=1 Tax=Rhodoferax sp. TaxID=50421 RepID=UPI002727E2D2|nr:coiled-coil domain-containing protein [Rhodoferax sp.]MDO9144590.1 DUF1640 domain-containing protein [Rhodoferax sp.]
MTWITFDTHKFVRKLQEAGFEEKQAEGLTEAMRAAIDESELVTKKDLQLADLPHQSRFEFIELDDGRPDCDSGGQFFQAVFLTPHSPAFITP